MTKTKLNIESWNRKEHFRFFSAFDDPFFGITTNVDFTTIYLEAKHDSQSFFLYSLHHILTKANETDEFKLRVEGGNSVVKYDTIEKTEHSVSLFSNISPIATISFNKPFKR